MRSQGTDAKYFVHKSIHWHCIPPNLSSIFRYVGVTKCACYRYNTYHHHHLTIIIVFWPLQYFRVTNPHPGRWTSRNNSYNTIHSAAHSKYGCNTCVSASQSFFQIKFQYDKIKVASTLHFSVDFSASWGNFSIRKTNK